MRIGRSDTGGPIGSGPVFSIRAVGAHIRARIRNPVAILTFLALAGCAGNSSTTSTPVPAPAGWPQISLSRVAGGFVQPVHVAHAGDGSGRIFVVEQAGRIRILDNGVVLLSPFLDISAKLACCGEQGLLSVAFPPGFASKRYFYVNYTRNPDGATVVARYRVSAGNANVADPASEEAILTIPQPFSNHNGGQLAFGPDGYLYIGMGDGGSGCDDGDHAQNPLDLLGKMLRIDVDSGSPYAIPPSNPFVGPDGVLDEIWALGTRNPWRFSFDRANGNLYIADVGQNALEEIDFQPAASPGGENYGWDCYEGNSLASASSGCSTTATCAPASQFTFPVHQYTHGGSPFRCSITGGYVYRGTQYPSLDGRYVFADYCSGDFWSLATSDNGMSWTLDGFGVPIAGFNVTAFGENSAGELFVADDASGQVYRIEALADAPDCPAAPAPGCTTTAKSTLNTKRPAEDTKNKLIWKWLSGPALAQGDFGDPIAGGTAYRLCVYNGAGSKVIDVAVPGGGAWQPSSTTGYKYRTPSPAADGGAFKVLLKGGDAGKSKLLLKAKGANLDLDALPLNEATQLRLQLVRNDSSACWEATFPAAAIDVDSAAQLKAKVP
jgi:glucose/arabinose dehydrogenase